MPYSGTNCPLVDADGNWELLGSIIFDPSPGVWEQVSIELSPSMVINGIAIGSSCEIDPEYVLTMQDSPYFFLDDFNLLEEPIDEPQITVDQIIYSEEVLVQNGYLLDDEDLPGEYLGSICSDSVFFSSSTVLPGDYYWYLDGVSLSSIPNPEIGFNFNEMSEGQYQLAIFDNGNCAVSEVDYSLPLISDVSFDVVNPCYPDSVQLISQLPDAFENTNLNWFVDDTFINSDSIAFFESSDVGPVLVELQTTFANYCVSSDEVVLDLNPLPLIDFELSSPCEGMENPLTNLSDDSSINSWSWEAQELLLESEEFEPDWQFLENGEYQISLSAINDSGCESELIQTLTVLPNPEISVDPDVTCLNSQPTLYQVDSQIDSGEITEWQWDFGDENSSTLSNPEHVYDNAEKFEVTVSAGSSEGCYTDFAFIQSVSDIDAMGISGPYFDCNPLCVEFSAEVENYGNEIYYQWNFSDGSTSEQGLFENCFENNSAETPLEIDAELSVSNEYGCESELIEENWIVVYPNPNSEFDVLTDGWSLFNPEINLLFEETDLPEMNWILDQENVELDGTTSLLIDETGSHEIELLLVNEYGCQSSFVQVINLIPELVLYVPNAFTPNLDDINELFIPVVNAEVIEAYELSVFNRWGELIFKTNDPLMGWNGRGVMNGEYYASEFINILFELKLLKILRFKFLVVR